MREHDDNDNLKIATQSMCVTVYTRQYQATCRPEGDYRISTRFNSGRQKSRRFRYSGVYSTYTRKQQMCKGLRSAVNMYIGLGDRAKYRPTAHLVRVVLRVTTDMTRTCRALGYRPITHLSIRRNSLSHFLS